MVEVEETLTKSRKQKTVGRQDGGTRGVKKGEFLKKKG